MNQTNTGLLLALLFTGTLMGALDLAIIGPALPVIQAEFGMQQRELAGLINAYTLVQMIGALLLAKLTDRHGARAIYLVSIITFAAGSLLIVIATDSWMLYSGRALQGFGAGGFFPASAAVIGARLQASERGKALGILGMVWGLAFIIGPILGGIFLRFAWQWLFAINLPIAAVLIVGAIKLLPGKEDSKPLPFDLKGMLMLLVVMSALVMAVTGLDTNNPLDSLLSLPVGGGFILFIALTLVFWQLEKRAHDPIVKPALFHSKQITKSCLITTGYSAIQTGTIFLPALLVAALDVSPADSSLLLLPGIVAATIAAPITGRLINKVGTRLIIVVGQILVMFGLLIYAFTDLNIVTFLLASIVGGFGTAGLAGAPLRYIVLAETGAEDRASAQGLISVVASVGRLLGASAVGAIATSQGGGAPGYQAAFVALFFTGVLVLLMAMTLQDKSAEKND
ncbi:MAG: MFS transporter [Gammaproteobacteria bacterium]|nr:MFS transporter [Gammaproteobacteria bacterium]